MADTTTSTYGLTKPEVGASEDTWGEKINDNFDDLDDLLDGTTPITGIDINSGTIDGATIATSDVTVGSGKTLDVSAGTLTLADDQISGDKVNGGTIGSVTITSADINGGTIDNTVIGGSTPAAGSFTTGSFTGDVSFGDNDKAIFGAGSDLQIYHDGTHSRIVDAGTGNLNLQGDNLRLKTADSIGTYLEANNGGAVTITYNSSPKLATTSTGIDVTGTVTAGGLTVDGDIEINDISPSIYFGESDATDVNTRIWSNGGKFEVQTRDDGNTGIARTRISVDNPTGDISFYEATGTTPKMVWKAADERLGIGTDSPSTFLDIDASQSASYGATSNNDVYFEIANRTEADGQFSGMRFLTENAIGVASWWNVGAISKASNYDTDLVFQQRTGSTTFSEAMRIDSSGNLLVGGTSVGADETFAVGPTGSVVIARVSGSGRYMIDFNNGGANVGRITTSTTSTTYGTSSDYRLKTDAQPITGASARVQALKPVNFEWIADGTRVDGFLAHEAQAVVPEAVTGTKDAVDAEGNPEYQGIDQSKLVPLLTAALQEALTKIDDLETRLTALEGA